MEAVQVVPALPEPGHSGGSISPISFRRTPRNGMQNQVQIRASRAHVQVADHFVRSLKVISEIFFSVRVKGRDSVLGDKYSLPRDRNNHARLDLGYHCSNKDEVAIFVTV